MKQYVSPDLTLIAVLGNDILTESVLNSNAEGEGLSVSWSDLTIGN